MHQFRKDKIGVCPKCIQARFLTKHHVLPQRYYSNNKFVLLLCSECHREIEKVLPHSRKLRKEEYLEITKRWLRGDNPIVVDRVYFKKEV
jgi:hypothetical protein